MNKSRTLVFFGNERLSSGFELHGAPTLQALIDHGYDVKAVVAHYEKGASRNARALELQTVADQHNIPVLLPDKPSLIVGQLMDLQADAAVLAAYGRIIPQSVIDIFPYGILNIHPSLLPEYRGPTPIEQAILDGTAETGVSIMRLVRAMDAGPIYAQQKIALKGTETKQELTTSLLTMGIQMLIEILPRVFAGSAQPWEQDESQATCTSLIRKEDGILDPSKSAARLEHEVRAYAGWPKSRLQVGPHTIIVTKAHVAQEHEDPLSLACNPGFLHIDELIAPSGKKMSGAEFLRGYRL